MAKASNKTISSMLKGITLPTKKAVSELQEWRDNSSLWRDDETRLPTQLYPFRMRREGDAWLIEAENSKGHEVVLATGIVGTFAAFRMMFDLYEEYFPTRAVEQVYFIGTGLENGKMIKVGYSLYPEARLKQLQTGHPERLKILATTPGGRWLEEKYHRRWRVRRAAGEWFYMGDCIRQEIERLNNAEK